MPKVSREKWRKLVHPYLTECNYRISSKGRVETITGEIITGELCGDYNYVKLRGIDKRSHRIRVCKLVAEAFLPQPERGAVLKHKSPEKPGKCLVENLYYEK